MDSHAKDGRFSQDRAERQKALLGRFKAIDPKNRGVIVVDTCSLFSLAGKALQDKYCFDILTILSEHGYKILIPDMVAFEASQVLPNGKYLGRYFSNKRAHPGLVRFLEDIAKGKHPNMSIVRTEEPARVRDFIEGLVEITNHHRPGQEARQLIIDHQDKHHKRKDWGDDAIREIVKKLPISPPVHVLTQDHKFLNDIGLSMPDLNVLSSGGLFLGLAESGLSEVIPFLDHSANAKQLLASCNRSLVEQKRGHWASKVNYDVSMAVVHSNPRVPHDCPMHMSLSHTALTLGHNRPSKTNPAKSIIASNILTEDEEETLHVRQLKKENKKARKYLKGGLGNSSGGGGWLKL